MGQGALFGIFETYPRIFFPIDETKFGRANWSI